MSSSSSSLSSSSPSSILPIRTSVLVTSTSTTNKTIVTSDAVALLPFYGRLRETLNMDTANLVCEYLFFSEEKLSRIANVFKFTLPINASIEVMQEQCFDATVQACVQGQWDDIRKLGADLLRLSNGREESVYASLLYNSSIEAVLGLHKESWTKEKKLKELLSNINEVKPLHYAAQTGNVELFSGLTEYGYCSVDEQDAQGKTPLYYLIESDQLFPGNLTKADLVASLLAKGASVIISSYSKQEGDLRIPLRPIDWCVVRGEIECFKKILEAHKKENNDPFATASELGNFLHLAIYYGQQGMLEYLVQEHSEKAKELLKQPNRDGQPPLLLAAALGDCVATDFLCRTSIADLKIKDNAGMSALHVAAISDQVEIINCLYFYDPKLLNQNDTSLKRPYDLVHGKGTDAERRLYNLMTSHSVEKATPPSFRHRPPKNLVFKGGGPKGLAYLGALEAMEKNDLLKNVVRIAGTSAGAITATFLAFGVKSATISKELEDHPMDQFLDYEGEVKRWKELGKDILTDSIMSLISPSKAFAIPGKIFDTILKFNGLCEGEKFRKWINNYIYQITEIKNCTFGELRNAIKRGKSSKDGGRLKHLHMFAIKLGKRPEIVHFSSEDPQWDDLVVADALRASVSIPGVFKPHILHYKDKQGERYAKSYKDKQGKDVYDMHVDGGLICNFPLETFDFQGYDYQTYTSNTGEEVPQFNRRTLGFSLYSPNEQLPCIHEKAEGVIDLLKHLFTVYRKAEELIRATSSYNKHRVIEISNKNVGLLDFTLTEHQKKMLLQSGKSSTLEFFNISESDVKIASSVVLPLRLPAPYFVPDESILKTMKERLATPHGKTLNKTVVQILHGAPGMGKTELALSFANTYKSDFSFIAWIDATSEETRMQSYRNLANYLGVTSTSDEELLKEVHNDLGTNSERGQGKPWLLIFDNCSEAEWIKSCPDKGGSILLTTQQLDASSIDKKKTVSLHEVNALTEQLRKTRFKKISGNQTDDNEEIDSIIKELGSNPVVFTRAAFDLEGRRILMRDYLNDLQEKGKNTTGCEYLKPFREVWGCILDRLKKDSHVREWLNVCAYLTPRTLSNSLATLSNKQLVTSWCTYKIRGTEEKKHGNPNDMGEIEATCKEIRDDLLAFSLLKREVEGAASLHLLEQAAILELSGTAYLTDALKFSDKVLHKPFEVGDTFTDIGNLFFSLALHQEAVTWHEKALAVWQSLSLTENNDRVKRTKAYITRPQKKQSTCVIL